ncbi:Type 1 glutamine amidotransferase-like domain-containing protein [Maribacter arcticus]|uniref:Peptidase E n=1 Tax=Maribacter arcticus TaxID=561365 RepID=A0A1T5CVC6_9FLAO|nr:peptidase E [Maribacter arcticus]MDA9089564.1 peptidase E [Maribacter arcticus]SKB63374.1 Peptidase E [Maribacter arcticus]|tara:strand:- start:366 stop:1061 length:696 start_codon:yes stop_codon:yes gene_type:complete
MKRQLLIYGSGRHTVPFLKYMAEVTGKNKPNLCFIPTASGEDQDYIDSFYEVCAQINVVPHVISVWINSYDQKESFDEVISKMDAIVVGGGNTLNMLAIWKAQSIDAALKKAYNNGVVMGGGSAGSLCWFNGGTTDSRPKELSIVEGMKFIDKSHCPHYNSEKSRRPLYHNNIISGQLSDGYACDDRSAIHFINEEVYTSISLDDENHSYYVHVKNDGAIEEVQLPNTIVS